MVGKTNQQIPHPGDNRVCFGDFYETALYVNILNMISIPAPRWLLFGSGLVYDMLLCN